MSDEVFGPLVIGTDVEQAALNTLQTWAPEYIPWVARKVGRDPSTLPLPRSWVTSVDTDRWPEEQLPSVMLVSTGLTDEPQRDGRGVYTAHFAIGLAVVVSARDRAETDELAKIYTAALRAILLQHQSLGGIADAVEWVDERYDVLPERNRRQLAAGQVVFRIQVPNVISGKNGPRVVRQDPIPPYPNSVTVVAAEADIEPTEEL